MKRIYASIGVAKRIHVIVKRAELSNGEWWGVSLCGWAGLAQPSKGPKTCWRCR